MGNKEEMIKTILNKQIDKLTEYSVTVNKNKPFFNKSDYNKVIEGIPTYYEPDEYNRTSGAIAIISKYTLSIEIEKNLKYPDPNGWTEEIENVKIFQRCHCIAYSLSAKKNDKNNIFIGTSYLNKKIMRDVERKILKHIKLNESEEIIYRVTPQYKGKNQIPTGVLIEAKSKISDFTLCEFCYNIMENVKFDYSDGEIIKDNRKLTKFVQNIQVSRNEKKSKRSSNVDFVVNTETKKYHLENCSALNNVNPKYLTEITTKENKLTKKGFSACKICNNI